MTVTVVLTDPLKRLIWDFQSVIELAETPRERLLIGGDVLRRALAERGWLPEPFARIESAPKLRQLYEDGQARFVLACLALPPGRDWLWPAGPGWRMVGALAGAARLIREGREPTPLTPGVLHAAGDAGQAEFYANPSDAPALLLIACDAAALPASAFDNPPDAPPFDIFTIQTRIED